MADKDKRKKGKKGRSDEDRLITDEEIIADDLDENSDVDNFDLDEDIPEDTVFSGRGFPPDYESMPDILETGPLPDPRREPIAGTIDDRFRRARASSGSALEGAEKTQGYTPSEGETFTFDDSGQMVVPSGRTVEKFAPGVRAARDKLMRRGADPAGTSPPSPRPTPVPAVTPTRPESTISPTSMPTKPSPAGPLPIDSRFGGTPAPTGQPKPAPVLPLDSRYGGSDALDSMQMPPMEEGEEEDGDIVQSLQQSAEGGLPPLPEVGVGQGGQGRSWSDWQTRPGIGHTSEFAGATRTPVSGATNLSETMNRTALDPRYQAKFDTGLENLDDARTKGARDIEGAIGRSLQTGQSDAARFQEGRKGALDAYMAGMDREDRRQFIDTIAGSLGKIFAGGIGLGKNLNVAAYYDYKPYDVEGGRRAQQGRFDASMRLQNEMEKAAKEQRSDEVKAYETLANFRANMSDKMLGRTLEMMNMTKQVIQNGYNVKEDSLFNHPIMMEFLKMEENRQQQYLNAAQSLLEKMIGAEAARQAAQGARPPLIEYGPPDRGREDALHSSLISFSNFIKDTPATPDVIANSFAKFIDKMNERNALTGSKGYTEFQLRVFDAFKAFLKTIPPKTVIQNPKEMFIKWGMNDKTKAYLGVQGVQGTEFQDGKPVLRAPITPPLPSYRDLGLTGETQPIPGGIGSTGTIPPRMEGGARSQTTGEPSILEGSDGRYYNAKTRKPIQSEGELNSLLAQDKKQKRTYPAAAQEKMRQQLQR